MNPHSRLASFYRYFYLTTELPNNLCNYFWGLIIALISSPFVWLAMIINRSNNNIYLTNHTEDIFGLKKVHYHYVKKSSSTPTALGLVFTLLVILIGFFVGCIITILGLSVPLPIGQPISGALILYTIGILSIFGSIGVSILFGLFLTYIKKFKKQLSYEELEDIKAEYYRKRKEQDIKLLERYNYQQANPNFIKLAWRALVAWKNKHCPLITWNYEKNKDN